MSKYKVRVELSFSADVWVEAADEDNACDIVSNSFVASIGKVSDGGDSRIVDWYVPYHVGAVEISDCDCEDDEDEEDEIDSDSESEED